MPAVTKQQNKPSQRQMPAGIAQRIKPVSELTHKGLKMTVYGRSGTGKTRFACTAPKPLLIVGLEDGTESVRNDKDVEFIPITDSEELKELHTYCSTSSRYKTIVIDTATMLQDLILKEVLGLTELPAQKSWGMATQQQYGQCSMKTKEYLRAYLNLCAQGINIIVLCQEKDHNEGKDSEVLRPSIGSALTGSVAGWLHPYCDYVGQTFVRKETVEKEVKLGSKTMTTKVETDVKEFCFRTGVHDIYATKFRLPRGKELPECIVDPEFNKIIDLIR